MAKLDSKPLPPLPGADKDGKKKQKKDQGASAKQKDLKKKHGKKQKKKDFGGYKVHDSDEFEQHAAEVKRLMEGTDFVEPQESLGEKRPPAFDRKELGVVRSWVKRRPLEVTKPASAMIEYPRMWNTKRGRYCKFKAPGAGVYAILRARPTY